MSASRDDDPVRVTTEIDVAYAAYDEHPLDEADEWGDLESFHTAAALPQVRHPSPG